MAKEIKKVAVLGAGIMGSGIAAHLANAGIECFLLDIDGAMRCKVDGVDIGQGAGGLGPFNNRLNVVHRAHGIGGITHGHEFCARTDCFFHLFHIQRAVRDG